MFLHTHTHSVRESVMDEFGRFNVNPLILNTYNLKELKLSEIVIVIDSNVRCFFCLQKAKFFDDTHDPIIMHVKNCGYNTYIQKAHRFDSIKKERDLKTQNHPECDHVLKYQSRKYLSNGMTINCPRKPIFSNNTFNDETTIIKCIETQIIHKCKICGQSNEEMGLIRHLHNCLFNNKNYSTDDMCSKNDIGFIPSVSFFGRMNTFANKTVPWGYCLEMLASFGFLRSNKCLKCICGFELEIPENDGYIVDGNIIKNRRFIPYKEAYELLQKIKQTNDEYCGPRTNIILEHIIYASWECKMLISVLGRKTYDEIVDELRRLLPNFKLNPVQF